MFSGFITDFLSRTAGLPVVRTGDTRGLELSGTIFRALVPHRSPEVAKVLTATTSSGSFALPVDAVDRDFSWLHLLEAFLGFTTSNPTFVSLFARLRAGAVHRACELKLSVFFDSNSEELWSLSPILTFPDLDRSRLIERIFLLPLCSSCATSVPSRRPRRIGCFDCWLWFISLLRYLVGEVWDCPSDMLLSTFLEASTLLAREGRALDRRFCCSDSRLVWRRMDFDLLLCR